ncbi:hypothetical protein WOLCODRAFT_160992 [Wolfiporia cocos MD-104 SS10]|uniref:Uncharacterized protein n=1 Tax=Wolfiporia cocos (strain MD-104) TaxID=742152 RepID=A0A2H3J659_WOLCO|nr:hypothetical protein WOLCODRAFT_160992 [Wolfiporia cocos MD-104 SS10]
MSVATPTVLPRSPLFPHLLPQPPQPHPTPLGHNVQSTGRLNSRRDLQREMDDLSDEEDEWDDLINDIHNRGFNFLVPIGRTFTRHEEKNDASADEGSDESDDDSEHSDSDSPSVMDDADNESAEEDLDADMVDMDDEAEAGDLTAYTAELDEFTRSSSAIPEDEGDEGYEEPASDL